MNHRERVLKTLRGEKVDRMPCFSGMGNVTVHGLERAQLRFAELHSDAEKMAAAAASTYRLFGFECAVVPFDLGMEAEALGCELNFYDDGSRRIIYPTVRTKVLRFGEELEVPEDLLELGRIPVVAEALGLLRDEMGGEVAVGSYVLGPYTLAGQIMDLNELLKNSFKNPAWVRELLFELSGIAQSVAGELRRAGADYITVREMGAPADVISPRMFSSLVLGPLKETIAGIKAPTILHICGDTNPIVELMASAGANAILVDQKNDVRASVEKLRGRSRVLGNIDPYGVLVKGSPRDVEEAVREAVNAGVSGVSPGCDVWPEVPADNMRMLVEAVERLGASPEV